MSKITLEGNASGTGTFTIAAPNSNTSYTLTLPTATGTIITTAGGAAISGTTGAFTTTVGVGGATPAASGAGITFPATASASSDANTLDDYEEGTFSPLIIGTTTAGTGTYTTQLGFYTKIGNVVYIQVFLVWSAHTGTGSIYFGGLPFTSKAVGFPQYFFMQSENISITAGNTMYAARVESNDTAGLLIQTPTGTNTRTIVPMDAAGSLNVAGFYFVS
jgi:hypothetical protein